jgi:hypothetical protein
MSGLIRQRGSRRASGGASHWQYFRKSRIACGGSIVPHEALVAHLPTADPEALYILLTQDCDILHHDYDAEPDVELHVARAITEPDGNLFHAKNPRRLQFSIASRTFEIKICERCHAPRVCLVSHVPCDLTLTEDDIRTIIGWTANRYLRSAFPDTFNQRLAAAKRSMKRIEAALKRDGSVITGIFLRVDPPQEIAPEVRYQVIMRLTAREEVFEQPEPETRALELTELIRREFDLIDGIEIVDYALVSEADFSLADLRSTLRWDYDYLSYREGALGDTPPTAI